MSFFLFSQAQKKDTNYNKKFFNLNNKIVNKEFNDIGKKNFIIKNKISNKKDLMQVISIPHKKSFTVKQDNLGYSVSKDHLILKVKLLEKINYLEYDKNLLNGSFNKFYIFNSNKDIYNNTLKDKNFIISKLKKFRNNEKNNFNKKNLNNFKIENINNNYTNSKKL